MRPISLGKKLELFRRASIKLRLILSTIRRKLVIRLRVFSGLYPRYALNVVNKDNSRIDLAEKALFHVFLAEGSGMDRDSIRFSWLKSGLTDERNFRFFRLSNDDIFLHLAEYSMPTYFNKLYKNGGNFEVPHKDYADPIYRGEQWRYRNRCKGILKKIHAEWRIDAIISGGPGDSWSKEANLAAKELGIPWFIAHREPVMPRANLDHMAGYYKRYFKREFELVFSHSQYHAEYWEACGIDRDHIRIVGEPKSDYWFRPELWPRRTQIHPGLRDDRVLVLYFGFGPSAYLGKFRFPDEQRDWTSLIAEHERVLFEIAAKYSDRIQLVWKGGHVPDIDLGLAQRVRARGLTNVLLMRSQYSAQELLVNADMVIGLQSTAMIESMFTSKPIIYGGWGGLHDDIVNGLLPLHKTVAVTQTTSSEHMKRALTDILDNPPPYQVGDDVIAARKEFRERYFYRADGNASKRMLDEISSWLAERAQGAPVEGKGTSRPGVLEH